MLHDIVARHEVDEIGAELLGEAVRQLVFLVGLALVANQPAQAHAAGIGVFQNALGDVVGRIHGHHLAGHDDVDFLRLVLADGHGEAAANHVAEHVVGDVINAFVSAVLLEEVDRGDDAAAGAANSGLRSAGLDATNVVEADLHHVFEFEILDAAGFRREAQNGVLRLLVKNQTGGVRLGVAAHDENLLAHLGERREGVLGSGGFTDATLPVECDLTKFCHLSSSLRYRLIRSARATRRPKSFAHFD